MHKLHLSSPLMCLPEIVVPTLVLGAEYLVTRLTPFVFEVYEVYNNLRGSASATLPCKLCNYAATPWLRRVNTWQDGEYL